MPASGQTLTKSERSSVLGGVRLSEGLVLPQVEAEQMGNQAVLRLSLDEAVEMALEQNLDIRVQRLSPLIQDISILDVRSAWAPTFNTTIQNNSQVTPSTSQLSGGLKQINTDTLQNAVGITQLTPWGGNYSVNWDGNRQSTSSFFTSFNPALRSTVSVQYVQPLLRNLKIDNVRQRLQISRTNRDISDIQLRDTITSTLRQVKNAYWELSAAIATFAVQQQSLELAEESLRNNRTRVEVGTMAPIDIVEAEAEVARN
ncbi:MAG: TolC family protein, partial [Acidobacteriota bacterium]|nr:TolC family protein [Acidobacteriota bacterium]